MSASHSLSLASWCLELEFSLQHALADPYYAALVTTLGALVLHNVLVCMYVIGMLVCNKLLLEVNIYMAQTCININCLSSHPFGEGSTHHK